ncbi:MAG: TetR/AcrR family transcriptional regulator [Pyrinomonadaceae bacterium]|nr:TetR/AcrR family transcriptional regulator [Pyrinomonadaceae bacterium]
MSKELTPSKQSVPEAPPAPTAPQGARLSAEERRREIVRVAVKLFSQRGFRGTTTKEIAHAAGVSEAIIFRHFATKEELYRAIIDHVSCEGGIENPHEVVGEAIARKDDRAVFEGLAFHALEHHEDDKEFHRLLLYAALEGHELAQMFWERTVIQFYEFLGAYIEERQRDGAMRSIDARVIVRTFIGTIIHHSLNNNLWDPERRLLSISNEEAARSFTEVLLKGITLPEGERSRGRVRPARRTNTGRNQTKKKQSK